MLRKETEKEFVSPDNNDRLFLNNRDPDKHPKENTTAVPDIAFFIKSRRLVLFIFIQFTIYIIRVHIISKPIVRFPPRFREFGIRRNYTVHSPPYCLTLKNERGISASVRIGGNK